MKLLDWLGAAVEPSYLSISSILVLVKRSYETASKRHPRFLERFSVLPEAQVEAADTC